jgi:hypothetical protein
MHIVLPRTTRVCILHLLYCIVIVHSAVQYCIIRHTSGGTLGVTRCTRGEGPSLLCVLCCAVYFLYAEPIRATINHQKKLVFAGGGGGGGTPPPHFSSARFSRSMAVTSENFETRAP